MSDVVIPLLRNLRQVRRFSPRAVPPDAVADLLEVARWTGSGRNRQPWEFILVRDPGTLRDLAAAGDSPGTRHLAEAPLAVVVVMSGPGFDFDEGRLVERILLAAAAYGLGAGIAGIRGEMPAAAAKKLLDVPPERGLRTIVAIGYPAEHVELPEADRHALAALPAGRKPLADLLHHERYGQRDD